MNNENMKFLIERMDRHHESLREEISVVRDEIKSIGWVVNKMIGAAMIISGIVSMVVQYFTGGK
jgi:hypothetical protein